MAPWYIRAAHVRPVVGPDYYEEVINRTPMRRIGEPEGCGRGLPVPAAASYVTGECIAVDGGFLRYGF